MPTAQADIRSLVDSFVSDLTRHIRAAAVEAVQAALMNGSSPARAAAAPKPQGKRGGKKTGAAKAAKGGRRARRSPEELEAAKAKILAHVEGNPGTAMGDISASLGEDPITIRAQLNELLEDGALRKEGERRGTRYFAGSGGKAAAKSATKKKTGKKGGRRKAAK